MNTNNETKLRELDRPGWLQRFGRLVARKCGCVMVPEYEIEGLLSRATYYDSEALDHCLEDQTFREGKASGQAWMCNRLYLELIKHK